MNELLTYQQRFRQGERGSAKSSQTVFQQGTNAGGVVENIVERVGECVGKGRFFNSPWGGGGLGDKESSICPQLAHRPLTGKFCDKGLKVERVGGLFRVFNSSTSSSILLFWSFVEERVCFHEDTKERKGMGTSPFGALRLTTVPSPCVSVTFLGNRTQDCQNGGTADYADWSRLGAGYRRQDCQNGLRCAGTHKGAKIRKGHKGSWLIS